MWCIYSGAITSKNNLSFQNVTLVCNQKCLSVFFMSSGSVVYHVLEYFKGCYTRQSNSPCIVTLPSSGYAHRCNTLQQICCVCTILPRSIPVILHLELLRVLLCTKVQGLTNNCNLGMAIFCASEYVLPFVYSSFIIRSAVRFPVSQSHSRLVRASVCQSFSKSMSPTVRQSVSQAT